MAKDNKGAAPDMGDLSDVSAMHWTFFWTAMIILCWKNKNNVLLDWTNFYTFNFFNLFFFPF